MGGRLTFLGFRGMLRPKMTIRTHINFIRTLPERIRTQTKRIRTQTELYQNS
jgi:hypothetical protein